MLATHPRLSNLLWGGVALCGLLLALGLLAAGSILFRAEQTKVLRCYWIDPPLTHTELALLTGKGYECTAANCRAVASTLPGRGFVCYFPRPLAYPLGETTRWLVSAFNHI